MDINLILIRKKREKIINSESNEAKKYDLLLFDTYLYGNIKIMEYYFQCSKCENIYEINELEKLEKNKKLI